MHVYKITFREIHGDSELDWVRSEISESGGQSNVGSHYASGKLVLYVRIQDFSKFCANFKTKDSYVFMESCIIEDSNKRR